MAEKQKILVVDDSSLMRTIITTMVKKNDALEVVGQASDGEMAIQLFKEQSPHIVTMDITMPKVDGLAAVKEIMKINPNTKILVVTAQNDEAMAIRAMKAGAMGFLGKPFNEQTLSEAIKGLLA
ncbi:MAG: response regulator [Spirochaetes bacterium]|nr:response regulator [Spirochaetota bacterium]